MIRMVTRLSLSLCLMTHLPSVSLARFLRGDRSNIALRRTRQIQASEFPLKYTRVRVSHYGGPDALEVLEEDCPEPKGGEVRVKMLAAGVALPDIMMREGIHPETPRVPFTPGWDLIGVVDRLGDGISGIEPGQVVAALPIH